MGHRRNRKSILLREGSRPKRKRKRGRRKWKGGTEYEIKYRILKRKIPSFMSAVLVKIVFLLDDLQRPMLLIGTLTYLEIKLIIFFIFCNDTTLIIKILIVFNTNIWMCIFFSLHNGWRYCTNWNAVQVIHVALLCLLFVYMCRFWLSLCSCLFYNWPLCCWENMKINKKLNSIVIIIMIFGNDSNKSKIDSGGN
jgi:hypothetical protein